MFLISDSFAKIKNNRRKAKTLSSKIVVLTLLFSDRSPLSSPDQIMKQDSDMEADSTLPECGEKEAGISDVPKDEGHVEELSTENEGKMKEATSSVVQEEDSEMKENFPTEQVDEMKEDMTEVGNTPKDGNFDEKCIEEVLPKKKKTLKVKRKIIKKTPTTRLLRGKKALVEQDDEKKEKDVLVAQEVGETLEAECSIKENEVNVAQEVEETLATQCSTQEKEVVLAQEVVETLEAHCSRKEEEVDVAQEVRETLEAQCSKKEKEVDVAQGVGETQEVQCFEKEKEVDVAQGVGETQEVQCSEKEKEVDVAQEVGETLEAQCSEKEKEDDVAQEMGETLEAQCSEKEKEVDVAQEVGETLEAQNPIENSSKPESKMKKINKILKVKKKIVKKSPASNQAQEVVETQEGQCSEKGKEVDVAQEVGETLEAQNPIENSSKPESKMKKILKVKKKIVKKSPASNRAQGVVETQEAQCSEKGKEVDVAQEVGETLEAQNPIENSSKPESKMKKINKILKVKKKIVKKSPASNQTKTNKLQSSPKVQARKRLVKNKSTLQENGEGSEKKVEDSEKPNQDEKANGSIAKEECIEKGEETSTSHKNNSELKNIIKEQKTSEKVGSSDNNIKEQKTSEKVGSSDKSIKNRKRNRKDRDQRSRREDKNEENLGGLIFMCSAKTKPDCFHYNVMGVSVGKKDAVEAIKPGLKLFLYDFDLKLLYGIYKASSSGGMKLEPKAFNGAFPAQVRFSVYKDCLPLPENIFKKAIQENYYEKHKFKFELTVKQVRKLSDLFRPIGPHSSSAIVRSRPEIPIRDRKGKGKDTRIRNSRSKGEPKNDRLSSHRRDRHRGEASRRREEVPRDLYRSEKDYRTYGLREERRNDYERRHLEPRYRDDVSAHAQRDVVRADRVYFNGKDYPVYSVDSRSQISPPRAISGSDAYRSIYTRQYPVPLIDPYLLPSRREEAAPSFLRSYVADTDPMRHVHHKDVESDRMPVSSRYAFAGPSYLYR